MGPEGKKESDLERVLRRVEASSTFARSAGLARLLRFLVETAERDPTALKETYVGTVFYNRDATYDPRYDSLVRVNVARLRKLLAEYAAGEGAKDDGLIEIPKGTYVPVYRAVLREVVVAPEVKVAAPAAEVTAAVVAPVMVAAEGKRRGWLLPVAAVALLVVGLGSALGWKGYRELVGAPAFVRVSLVETPLTMGRDLEFEPAMSVDGRRLAYVSRAAGSGHFQIFLRSVVPDGKGEQVLQTGPEDALYPAWSPDGRQIAFLRCGIGPCEIAIVPVGGGEVRPVRTLPRYSLPDDVPYYQYRQLNPVWTKDGTKLIYPYRGLDDDAERLVELDLTNQTQRQLTFGGVAEEDGAPAISRDGRSVAFLRRHLSTSRVVILDLATLSTRVLGFEMNHAASGLTWAPDGRGVVVGVNPSAQGLGLYWLPLHGEPRKLTTSFPLYMNPVFAADGKSLMVLKVNRSRDLYQVTGEGQPKPLFPSRQRNAATTLSPDGSQLAFISDRSGSLEVWLTQRSGGEFGPPRQLTHGLEFYPLSISWSPNGRTLAVGISNTNRVELVDVGTGALRPLVSPGLENCLVWSPVWSADSGWVYVAVSGARSGLFRESVGEDGRVEEIAVGTPREVRIDGDRAVYYAPEFARGIYKVPLQGEARPELVPQLRDILPDRAWTIAGGRLYYFDVHDSERRLHALDLRSGVTTTETGPLSRISFGYGNPSYDPRSRLLIYSAWSEAAGSQVVSLRW